MPKERILPYVILGIVKQHPMITGQQIAQQFTNEIGEFWKSSHSQIYPELKRMVSDRWLAQSISEDNLKEKNYHLTNEGESVLLTWLQEPVQEPPVQRDLFSLKMFFIQDEDDERILTLLVEERQLLEEQLIHLEMRRKQLFDDSSRIQKSFGHYLILSRAITRVQGQLDWILEMIEER